MSSDKLVQQFLTEAKRKEEALTDEAFEFEPTEFPSESFFNIKVECAERKSDGTLVYYAKGQMEMTEKYIADFFKEDERIRIIKPKYLKVWKTKWRSGDAFIRHAQIADFMNILGIIKPQVDVFGLAACQQETGKLTKTWFMAALSPIQLEAFNQEQKNGIAREDLKKTGFQLVTVTAPLISLKTVPHQTRKGVLSFRLLLNCKLEGIHNALYKKIITSSIYDSLFNVALNYQKEKEVEQD